MDFVLFAFTDFSAAVDEPGIADRIPHYPKQPNLWGTRKSCSLVFFVNPHQIYCHLEEDFETLDRMMERLQSVYGTGICVSSCVTDQLNECLQTAKVLIY